MHSRKKPLTNKSRNIFGVVFIASIVVGSALLALGLFYMWSRGCEAEVLYAPVRPMIDTQCSE